MTPERWQHVGALFAAALEVPADGREAWLAAAEATDEVRQEVRALLDAHASAPGFLPTPPLPGHEPERQEPLPGDTLGPYKLLRVIGRGGMGVVFDAEDTRLHRRVALKAVAAGPGGASHEQRLRQEARAAAALVHPNIATVYALEEIDGRAYIASELLEGETLRAVLTRGPLAPRRALDIACALGSALEAAHARGIVHRDLKPENVLCLEDGRVKILDFGLARLLGQAQALSTHTRLTFEGMVAGTPGYMAPEQLEGLDVDPRTDQFALGVLTAEMVWGGNPFDGGTLAATIARVLALDGWPPPGESGVLGADLAEVVRRCTRRRPADRFPSTTAALRALEACREARTHGTPEVAEWAAAAQRFVTPLLDAGTGRRPPIWWWRFHQAAAAAIDWMMIVPAWMVHRQVPTGLPWFLACLAATIVAANVRLHLRFSAVVLPQELAVQRSRTRGWVALADWALILLWGYAGASLTDVNREWAVVFFAFAVGNAVAVALIEPATTRAAFESSPSRVRSGA